MNAIFCHSSGILNSITDSMSSAQPFQRHTNSYFTLRTKYFKVWFFSNKFCMQSHVNVGLIKSESKHLIIGNKRIMGIPCIYSLANVAPTDICENTLFIKKTKNVYTFSMSNLLMWQLHQHLLWTPWFTSKHGGQNEEADCSRFRHTNTPVSEIKIHTQTSGL
jgi:hypothetical protein